VEGRGGGGECWEGQQSRETSVCTTLQRRRRKNEKNNRAGPCSYTTKSGSACRTKNVLRKKTAPGSGTAKLTHSLVDVIRHKKRRGEGGREGGKQGRERGDKVDVYTRRGLTDD